MANKIGLILSLLMIVSSILYTNIGITANQQQVPMNDVSQQIDFIINSYNDTTNEGYYTSLTSSEQLQDSSKNFGTQVRVGMMYLEAYHATGNQTYLNFAEDIYAVSGKFNNSGGFVISYNQDFTSLVNSYYSFVQHALFIDFLVKLYNATGNSLYLSSATHVYHFIENKFSTGSGGYYFRLTAIQTGDTGVLQFVGYFGTYLRALWDLYTVTSDTSYYNKGMTIINFLINNAWYPSAGYFYPHLTYTNIPYDTAFSTSEMYKLLEALLIYSLQDPSLKQYVDSMLQFMFDNVVDSNDNRLYQQVDYDGTVLTSEKYLSNAAHFTRILLAYNNTFGLKSLNSSYNVYFNQTVSLLYSFQNPNLGFQHSDLQTDLILESNAISIQTLFQLNANSILMMPELDNPDSRYFNIDSNNLTVQLPHDVLLINTIHEMIDSSSFEAIARVDHVGNNILYEQHLGDYVRLVNTFVHLYHQTQNQDFLKIAKYYYDHYITKFEYNNHYVNILTDSFSISNYHSSTSLVAQVVKMNILLYNATEDTTYLDRAKELYTQIETDYKNSLGLYYFRIMANSANPDYGALSFVGYWGLNIEIGMQLYAVTNNATYYQNAMNTANLAIKLAYNEEGYFTPHLYYSGNKFSDTDAKLSEEGRLDYGLLLLSKYNQTYLDIALKSISNFDDHLYDGSTGLYKASYDLYGYNADNLERTSYQHFMIQIIRYLDNLDTSGLNLNEKQFYESYSNSISNYLMSNNVLRIYDGADEASLSINLRTATDLMVYDKNAQYTGNYSAIVSFYDSLLNPTPEEPPTSNPPTSQTTTSSTSSSPQTTPKTSSTPQLPVPLNMTWIIIGLMTVIIAKFKNISKRKH